MPRPGCAPASSPSVPRTLLPSSCAWAGSDEMSTTMPTMRRVGGASRHVVDAGGGGMDVVELPGRICFSRKGRGCDQPLCDYENGVWDCRTMADASIHFPTTPRPEIGVRFDAKKLKLMPGPGLRQLEPKM